MSWSQQDIENYTKQLYDEAQESSNVNDAEWWREFWDSNHQKIGWNDKKGIYELRN